MPPCPMRLVRNRVGSRSSATIAQVGEILGATRPSAHTHPHPRPRPQQVEETLGAPVQNPDLAATAMAFEPAAFTSRLAVEPTGTANGLLWLGSTVGLRGDVGDRSTLERTLEPEQIAWLLASFRSRYEVDANRFISSPGMLTTYMDEIRSFFDSLPQRTNTSGVALTKGVVCKSWTFYASVVAFSRCGRALAHLHAALLPRRRRVHCARRRRLLHSAPHGGGHDRGDDGAAPPARHQSSSRSRSPSSSVSRSITSSTSPSRTPTR